MSNHLINAIINLDLCPFSRSPIIQILDDIYTKHTPKFDEQDSNGMSAIMHAVRLKDKRKAEIVVDWICNKYSRNWSSKIDKINLYDHFGKSALCYAVEVSDAGQEVKQGDEKEEKSDVATSRRIIAKLLKAGANHNEWYDIKGGGSNHVYLQATSAGNFHFLKERAKELYTDENGHTKSYNIRKYFLSFLPAALQQGQAMTEFWEAQRKKAFADEQSIDRLGFSIAEINKHMDHNKKMLFVNYLPNIESMLGTPTLYGLATDAVTTSWGENEKKQVIALLKSRDPSKKIQLPSNALILEIQALGSQVSERKMHDDNELRHFVENALDAIYEEKFVDLNYKDSDKKTALQTAKTLQNDFAARWICEKAIVEGITLELKSDLVDFADLADKELKHETKEESPSNALTVISEDVMVARWRPVVNLLSELLKELSSKEIHNLFVTATKAGNLYFIAKNMELYKRRMINNPDIDCFNPWSFIRDVIPVAENQDVAIIDIWINQYVLSLAENRFLKVTDYLICGDDQIARSSIIDPTIQNNHLKTFFVLVRRACSDTGKKLESYFDSQTAGEYLIFAMQNDWGFDVLKELIAIAKLKGCGVEHQYNYSTFTYSSGKFRKMRSTCVRDVFCDKTAYTASLEMILLFLLNFSDLKYNLDVKKGLPITSEQNEVMNGRFEEDKIIALFRVLEAIKQLVIPYTITPEINRLLLTLDIRTRQDLLSLIKNIPLVKALTKHINGMQEEKQNVMNVDQPPRYHEVPDVGFANASAPLLSSTMVEVTKEVVSVSLSSELPDKVDRNMVPVVPAISLVSNSLANEVKIPAESSNISTSLQWCFEQLQNTRQFARNPTLQSTVKQYAMIELIRLLYDDAVAEQASQIIPNAPQSISKSSPRLFSPVIVVADSDVKQEPNELQDLFTQLTLLHIYKNNPCLSKQIKSSVIENIISILYNNEIAKTITNLITTNHQLSAITSEQAKP